jgi:hypothetical protein
MSWISFRSQAKDLGVTLLTLSLLSVLLFLAKFARRLGVTCRLRFIVTISNSLHCLSVCLSVCLCLSSADHYRLTSQIVIRGIDSDGTHFQVAVERIPKKEHEIVAGRSGSADVTDYVIDYCRPGMTVGQAEE